MKVKPTSMPRSSRSGCTKLVRTDVRGAVAVPPDEAAWTGSTVDRATSGASRSRSERTFFRDLVRDDSLERELLRLTVSVAGSLRKEGLRARTLTVKVRDSDFTTRQRAHTFPEAVESESVIFPAARTLLADLRKRRRTGVRLLGVGLSNLSDRDAPRQLALFDDAVDSPDDLETDRDRRIARTVDALRTRFGRDAVLPGRIVDGGMRPRHSTDGRDGADDDPPPPSPGTP